MARMKIDFHWRGSQGYVEILRELGILKDLEERGDRIAAAADANLSDSGETYPNFEVVTLLGKHRARVLVVTRSNHAKAAEAKDRRLTRALDAGR